MSDPLRELPGDLEPDISHIVLDDGEPVDNVTAERQHRLLVDSLYASYKPGRPFVAMTNVGLFSSPELPPYVPDVLLSLDVLPGPVQEKRHRAYFIWVFGKPPDLVVEVVSRHSDGHEERKVAGYARLGIAYYVIYDPDRRLSSRELRVYELHGGVYVELLKSDWIPQLGLGLRIWEGEYQDTTARWLRWCDQDGKLLACGAEAAEQAREEAVRAQEEATRAQEEAARARRELEDARSRSERLAARLRELGLEE